MQVQLRYFGLVRNLVGQPEEAVELPDGTTVRGLVNALVIRYGPDLGYALLTAAGDLRPTARVLIDGHELGSHSLDTALTGGAEIWVVITVEAIAGG